MAKPVKVVGCWFEANPNHVLLIDSPVSTCFHCSNLRHFASNASVQIHRYSALHVSGARKKEAGSLRRRGPWWDMVGLCRCSQMLINKISGAANLPRKNCDQR